MSVDGKMTAEALHAVARQLQYLGNGDAATTMGAIEAHGQAIKEAAEQLSIGLDAIALALDKVAIAIQQAAGH